MKSSITKQKLKNKMSSDKLIELGLDYSVMAANEGNLPEEKFELILTTLKDDSIADDVRHGIVRGLDCICSFIYFHNTLCAI